MKVKRFLFEKLIDMKVVKVFMLCYVCLIILLFDLTILFLSVSQFLITFLFFKNHLWHLAIVWPCAIDFTYL